MTKNKNSYSVLDGAEDICSTAHGNGITNRNIMDRDSELEMSCITSYVK